MEARWQPIFSAWFATITGAVLFILNILEHADFLITRYQNPGWLGEMLNLAPTPTLDVLLFVLGVMWLTLIQLQKQPTKNIPSWLSKLTRQSPSFTMEFSPDEPNSSFYQKGTYEDSYLRKIFVYELWRIRITNGKMRQNISVKVTALNPCPEHLAGRLPLRLKFHNEDDLIKSICLSPHEPKYVEVLKGVLLNEKYSLNTRNPQRKTYLSTFMETSLPIKFRLLFTERVGRRVDGLSLGTLDGLMKFVLP